MRTSRLIRQPRSPMLLVLALVVALAFAAAPQIARANTSAGATVLNVVTVSYKTGTSATQSATASASVEVLLKASPLAFYAPPTTGAPGSVTCYDSVVASGSDAKEIYAIVATANGEDTYDLTLGTNPTNATTNSTGYQVLGYNSAVLSADPDLGAAVIVDVKDASTLYLSAGSLAKAGFAVDDIVLVEYDNGNKEVFLVADVSVTGTVPLHDNPGNADHTDQGATTSEIYAELQLKAYTAGSVGGFTVGGSGSAPAFTTSGTIPATGSVIGEMAYVVVTINATATTTDGSNGSVAFTVAAAGSSDLVDCDMYFQPARLTVNKQVKKEGGSFGATAQAQPGDTLVYQVIVKNLSSVAASLVAVLDNVPRYTTLYNAIGGAGNIATVTYNSATATPDDSTVITQVNSDTEDSSHASGDAAAGTAAGSAIKFYLGSGNVGPAGTGGTMAPGDFATIEYKVTID